VTLGHLEGSIKDNKRITKASIKAVVTMIDNYIDLDIIGDEAFIQQMTEFKNRHLVNLDDRILKRNPGFAGEICVELRRLATLAEDHAAINSLTQAYKSKIDI